MNAENVKTRFANAALVLVDVQNDFCPGGALAVREGDQVVPALNRLMPLFPVVIAGQDWHPEKHCSFKSQGGPWPPHCVQGTRGAELHPGLDQSRIAHYVRKADAPERDSYSEFNGHDETGHTLDALLNKHGVKTLYVGGLATDYCVRATVLDGLARGYEVYVITDAVRAVNVRPNDGEKALLEMAARGARLVTSDELLKP
jgi:nicotinamidase/pyrazinamidase